MENKTVFKQYYDRFAKEGIVKAVLCGLIAGFAVTFVIAFATWFSDFNGIWVSLGSGLLVGVGFAFVMYFKFFRPTTKSIARRIDRLGLEERIITMTELENDESYIAAKQREDAKTKLKDVDAKKIKFSIAKSIIIAAAIVSFLGVSMTTVSALAELGVIPSGYDFLPAEDVEDNFVMVVYMVADGEGEIRGEVDQIIKKGENATPVLAVPAEGYAFAEWSDGSQDPQRADMNVEEDLVLFALFMEVDPDDGDGDDDNQQQTDQPQDPDDQQDEDSDGQSTIYNPANQIIDGETAYQHEFDGYYEQMMEEMMNNPDLTPKQRKMLEKYFETLKTGGSEGGGDKQP